MYLTEDDLIVKTVLPGMKADELQIKIIGYAFSIKDEVNEKCETKEKA